MGTIANALPMPVVLLGSKQEVIYANPAAEQFFDTGLTLLRKQTLADLIAPHSPLFQLVIQAAERNASAGGARYRPLHAAPWRAHRRCDGNAGAGA